VCLLGTVETRDANLTFLRHNHPSGTMSMPRAVKPLSAIWAESLSGSVHG
jgi:hypothetical protein